MHFRKNLLEASLETLFSSQNQCNRNDTGLVGKKNSDIIQQNRTDGA